jgi:hypothetical protein
VQPGFQKVRLAGRVQFQNQENQKAQGPRHKESSQRQVQATLTPQREFDQEPTGIRSAKAQRQDDCKKIEPTPTRRPTPFKLRRDDSFPGPMLLPYNSNPPNRVLDPHPIARPLLRPNHFKSPYKPDPIFPIPLIPKPPNHNRNQLVGNFQNYLQRPFRNLYNNFTDDPPSAKPQSKFPKNHSFALGNFSNKRPQKPYKTWSKNFEGFWGLEKVTCFVGDF